MNPSEQSATRSRRKRRQNSCSGEQRRDPRRGERELEVAGRPARATGTGTRAAPQLGGAGAHFVDPSPLAGSDCKHMANTGPICSTRPLRQPSPEHKSARAILGGWTRCSSPTPPRRIPIPGKAPDKARPGTGTTARWRRAMRPATLADFVGQAHLLGPDSALRTAIEQGRPHSMILYGPPGTGKTTLARMVAEHRERGVRGAERRAGRPRRGACGARARGAPP